MQPTFTGDRRVSARRLAWAQLATVAAAAGVAAVSAPPAFAAYVQEPGPSAAGPGNAPVAPPCAGIPDGGIARFEYDRSDRIVRVEVRDALGRLVDIRTSEACGR